MKQQTGRFPSILTAAYILNALHSPFKIPPSSIGTLWLRPTTLSSHRYIIPNAANYSASWHSLFYHIYHLLPCGQPQPTCAPSFSSVCPSFLREGSSFVFKRRCRVFFFWFLFLQAIFFVNSKPKRVSFSLLLLLLLSALRCKHTQKASPHAAPSTAGNPLTEECKGEHNNEVKGHTLQECKITHRPSPPTSMRHFDSAAAAMQCSVLHAAVSDSEPQWRAFHSVV